MGILAIVLVGLGLFLIISGFGATLFLRREWPLITGIVGVFVLFQGFMLYAL